MQGGVDSAGFDDGGPAFGVELQNTVEMATEIDHHPAADRVARQRGPGAARREWDATFPADLERGEHLVEVAREDDGGRLDPVERGIARVDDTRGCVGPRVPNATGMQFGDKGPGSCERRRHG
ncbi:hypothetical protein ASH00_03165 [Arthrobacter sp. Soil782]|nr:hypothetical protein ASH00_03165 [Arthrobacter sp. Soil782]